MTQTRIYLPLSADGIRALARTGATDEGADPAYAVTAALRAASPGAGDEELEDAALRAAAAGAGVFAVAAADVDPHDVAEATEDDPARVAVAGPVPVQRIASIHVVDGADILWYDVTELAEVDRLAARAP